MNPLELRPCHNDFLPGNLIDDGARMRIVDWEYAGMGDPFFDLGNFCINNDLTPDEDEAFLAAYDGNATPRADRLARLTLFRDRVGLPRGDVGRAPAGDQHARLRLPRVRRRALRAAAGQRRDAALRACPRPRSATPD